MLCVKVWSIAIFVGVIFGEANCANILGIFHFPSPSHHILGHALLKGLAKDGHNVTMLSPFPVKETIANYTHLYMDTVFEFRERNMGHLSSTNTTTWSMLSRLSGIGGFVELELESEQMKTLLKPETKFDLLILFLVIHESFLALAHRYDVPVVGFQANGGVTTGNNLLGNPTPYAYVPSQWLSYTDEMTFLQRTVNTLVQTFYLAVYNFWMIPKHRGYIKKYFPGTPDVEELSERIDLLLVNSHVSTESPRPYVPNVIQIGGFHIEDPEPMSEELKDFLDRAEEGVIYFSFGSNVKSADLPEAVIKVFLQKFRKTPMKVLWKYEDDKFPYEAENIKTSKWLPQRAILGHKNVKAFVTHGGMGSISETLYHGVPVVCIPFFGDQSKNCADVVSYGIGKSVAASELTDEKFSDALDEILNNTKCREVAQFRSGLFKDQPIKPLDKAIFWINHVIKHKGAKHLKNKAPSLAWYRYFLLDVAAFLLGIFTAVVALIYFSVKFLVKKICYENTKNKIKRN